MTKEEIAILVDRFLTWPLPVSNREYPHLRSGTNLLTAGEARQMFEALLGDTFGREELLECSRRYHQSYGYLARLLQSVAPGTEPLDTLPGLCTQIDNVIAGLRAKADEARSVLRAAIDDGCLVGVNQECCGNYQPGGGDPQEPPEAQCCSQPVDLDWHARRLTGHEPPVSASGLTPHEDRLFLGDSEAIASERERLAGMLIDEAMRLATEGDDLHRRVAYFIAANAIRRGRFLTSTEQLENLAKAFDDEGDHDIAARLRRGSSVEESEIRK